MRLTWLGHSTVLIEAGGTRLLTDPLLRRRVLHLRRHGEAPAIGGRLDAVLISHLHHDHLHAPSLLAVDARAPVVVPRGAGALGAIRALGRDVDELAAGETLAFGDVRVRAVPAGHDGRRHPLGAETPALGFVFEAGRRVYFAGDTELFAGMSEIADELDVALLPVWGWGPRLGPGHMGPDEAARAAALLRPRLAVPIHWGTYLPLGSHHRLLRLLEDPGPAFAEGVARRAPDVRVAVLGIGEELEV